MKAGLIQYCPVWENKIENMKKIINLLQENFNDENLLIFPEMTLTGFTMNAEKFAEDIDGESIEFFMDIAKRFEVHIMAGIIERSENKIYNSLFHFDQNGLIIARYRKVHLFSMSGEDSNYETGNEQVITKIGQTKIGLSICYDLRFPELYRYYAKEQVEVIVNIASWPRLRSAHWLNLLRARAIENQCFAIGVNRVGNDPSLSYKGCSCVFNPMGEELTLAEENEKFISITLDMNEVIKTRQHLPFLKDIKLV